MCSAYTEIIRIIKDAQGRSTHETCVVNDNLTELKVNAVSEPIPCKLHHLALKNTFDCQQWKPEPQ